MSLLLEEFYLKCGDNANEIPVDHKVIENYHNKVPDEILELWEKGFGSYMNGFLWIINPDEFNEIVKELYQPVTSEFMTLARTAFGDFLIWENESIVFLNIRHGYAEVVGRKPNIFFNRKATELEYLLQRMKAAYFNEVKDLYGEIGETECYGFIPILAAGGLETLDKLKIVQLKEHLSLISQMKGKIY